ncbi:MAG: protein kinase [Candidatus Competibacteraceae bacterium]|nr:protein kinase [Candidatus Competibacteraceae bacterium]
MTQLKCMGCMTDRGAETVCSHCGFSESDQPASRQHLPLRTALQARYTVGRVLGEGGFGITYLGWDDTLALRVAIKEFLPRTLAGRSGDGLSVQVYQGKSAQEFAYGLEQFLDEARRLARFANHPGIATVRDFFAANQTGYLVMNYLDGVTLQDYLLRQGNRISVDQALDILLPVMDTLRDIHASGLLHRDISPDNLFVPDGKPTKLIDFGAARTALSQHSCSLSVVVKPGFAPEEQYRTRGEQGPWTDVYALGATLYWALTGERPPPAPDRAYQDTLLPPTVLGAILPAPAEDALLKALAVRSEQRFQTVEEFQTALLQGIGKADIFHGTPRVTVSRPAPPATVVNLKKAEPASNKLLRGRYWLSEKLGESEGVSTYLAIDHHTHQRCLIKQFFLEKANDWKSVELFEREIKTLKNLNHPHVPDYLDSFFNEEGHRQDLFLVREYLPGKTLIQHMAEGRRFTEQEARSIALVLAELLCYLHRFSPPLIHRDIKPGSLLLSEEEKIYLIDFAEVQDALKLSWGSTVAGTFDYQPPEQKRGKPVPASDIYSLGATLIHLLSGLRPSRLLAKDQRLLFRAHVNVSEEFRNILEKMVEPKLDRRYRTAARLLEDLQNLNVALPESRPFRIDKRLWLAGGLTVLVGLAGLIGFMGWPGSLVSLSMGPAIQEALERSSAVRTNVTEYFITSGKLPNSNADLKLPQPSAYRSSLVESISILPNGFIETKLNRNAINSGGTIYFKPLVNFETYFIEWKCLSPDIKQIAKIAQICTYEPGFSLK